MRVSLSDLTPLSLGAALLGTGGGGNPYTGRLALRRQIELSGREPELIDLQSVPDNALVASVLMAGSPSIGLEKLLCEAQFTGPLRQLERYLGRSVDALIPIEVGGVNSLLPLMTSCATGLPVIDADGMGRAFPTIDKTTFGIAGLNPCPNVLANAHGHLVIIDDVEISSLERVSRSVIVALGAHSGSACHAMSGAEVKSAALAGTMSLALRIGRALLAARAAKLDPAQAILDEAARAHPHAYGRVLFEGNVADIKRETIGGYNIGTGVLEGNERTLTFAFQNEYLYARERDRFLTIVPDLVMVVDRDTGEPITCESIRYGQRVTVLGMACFPELRTPAALKVCGPRAFGLETDFVPIETLTQGFA
jgi:uncharacterized protein